MGKLEKFRNKENPLSTKFTQKLNAVVDATEKANNLTVTAKGMKGHIKKSPKGNQIVLSASKAKPGGGGGSTVRRFITTEDAPAGNEIICNKFDSAGVEITTGVEGTDYNIPVICNISNGKIAQVDHATPADIEIGDIFTLTVELDAGGNDSVDFVASAATVTNVTNGLATAWNNEVGAEFARVSAQGTSQYLRLTADTDGEPFTVTGSATDGGGADDQTLTMATITENNSTGDLSIATPRLKDRDEIFAIKLTNWVCVSNFAATEDCTCAT